MFENALFFQETNTIAAVMFFFFAVSVSWVLVNVLLTIIIDGYENVKKELEGRKNELEVIQYIKVCHVLKSDRPTLTEHTRIASAAWPDIRSDLTSCWSSPREAPDTGSW